MPDQTAHDWGLWQTMLAGLGGFGTGFFGLYTLVWRGISRRFDEQREEIERFEARVKECEDEHVYKDVHAADINPIKGQLDRIEGLITTLLTRGQR